VPLRRTESPAVAQSRPGLLEVDHYAVEPARG
jgi:hypothetical protein